MKGFGPTVGDMVNLLARAQRSTSPPNTNPLSGNPPIPFAEEVRFFDWAMDEHPARTAVISFPEPGVVIAVCGNEISKYSAAELDMLITYQLRRLPIVESFLSAPESRFAPRKFHPHDIFLSYSSSDAALATELRESLSLHAANVFMASRSISVSERWEREIRDAICGARLVVLLLTPNSVRSDWVLFECGAAWALDTPIAIALSHVAATQLPAALSTYQCRRFETSAERQEFVLEVTRLLELRY